MPQFEGPSEDSPFQLFVEGNNDRHSIIHLLKRRGFNWDDRTKLVPHIRVSGDVDRLLKDLKITLKNPETYKVAAVVLDADQDLGRRWDAVRRILEPQDVSVPTLPTSEGFIASGPTGLRVGAWLMPDNCLPGSLDDFLGMLVPAGDACWNYSESVVDEAARLGAPYEVKSRAKAKIHTWLAWRKEPGVPLGRAITQSCFDTNNAVCSKFVDWFCRLFDIQLPPAS